MRLTAWFAQWCHRGLPIDHVVNCGFTFEKNFVFEILFEIFLRIRAPARLAAQAVLLEQAMQLGFCQA